MEYKALSVYVDALRNAGLLKQADVKLDAYNSTIHYLTYNSKEVIEKTLYVCKGAHFKAEYLDEALAKGALAYVSETAYRTDAACLLVFDVRKAMAVLANLFYEEPWRAFRLTGITGTKGKSTVVHYLKAILDEELSSLKEKSSGLVSSIRIVDGMLDEEAHLTTPESLVLMKHLANAREANLQYVTMEVSSQALRYERVAGIMFDIGVFINISEDHISPEEHSDYQDYFDAKLSIFRQSKHAIYNKDMAEAEVVSEAARSSKTQACFSTLDDTADYFASKIIKQDLGFSFTVKLRGQEEAFSLPAPGSFNIENALAALAVADYYGISVASMKKGLADVHVDGRMEYFASQNRQLAILVDYAHNKLSFERIFESIKTEYPDFSICTIFGCGGGKALPRRAQLGKAAARMTERIILTSEDPGYEDPADIAEDIGQHIRAEGKTYEYLENRGDAIAHAINTSSEKTIILVLGKGGERYQKIGADWVAGPSDLDYAAQLIAEYDKQNPTKL